jgi:hypothetical protein
MGRFLRTVPSILVYKTVMIFPYVGMLDLIGSCFPLTPLRRSQNPISEFFELAPIFLSRLTRLISLQNLLTPFTLRLIAVSVL